MPWDEFEPQYIDNAGVFHHSLYDQKRADDNIQLRKWLVEDGLLPPLAPTSEDW